LFQEINACIVEIILLCAGRDSIEKSFADILGLILLSKRIETILQGLKQFFRVEHAHDLPSEQH